MVKRTLIYLCLHALIHPVSGQQFPDTKDTVYRGRVWIAAASNATLWTGSYVALNKAWYSDYERSPFHFFNDNAEWNQMDKAGHVWSSYQVSRASAELWKWTGLDRNVSAVLGGAGGMVYQGIIEMQDAYSAQWGFSWGDMGANLAGSGLFVLQENLWQDQRIQIKMSYWPSSYPQALRERRDQIFGSSFGEQLFKDYNQQTYWLSANLSAFLPRSGLPEWMNISVGYGAGGLYGARDNIWKDGEGRELDYSGIARERKYYLAPDIDFTRINTRSKWLRSFFFLLNAVKIPSPALELNNKGRLRLRPVKF